MERLQGRLQPELRGSPAPGAPSLARERSLTSQPLVPPPQAPPPLTSEPRAGARREAAEPEPSPTARAGGRPKRAAAADGGRSSAPANSGLPASPAAGQPQVQPGTAPPVTLGAGGRRDPSAAGYHPRKMGGGAWACWTLQSQGWAFPPHLCPRPSRCQAAGGKLSG